MTGAEEFWIPLVDEPIGSIVEQLQADDPAIAKLVDSPRKLLAFRTFAYIRVGMLLGELLVENDLSDSDGKETWVEELLREPSHRAAVAAEVRKVAEEIAQSEDETMPVGPDDGTRERFREFARRQLG